MNITIDKKKGKAPTIKMGRKPKYPFAAMEVDNSFFVEKGTYASLFSCAQNFAKGTTKEFKCVVENKGVRVWRTK